MSHKARLERLERRFAERNTSAHFERLLDAMHSGDREFILAEERIEIAAGGRRGWQASLLASIMLPLEGGEVIAPEDLVRPAL